MYSTVYADRQPGVHPFLYNYRRDRLIEPRKTAEALM